MDVKTLFAIRSLIPVAGKIPLITYSYEEQKHELTAVTEDVLGHSRADWSDKIQLHCFSTSIVE